MSSYLRPESRCHDVAAIVIRSADARLASTSARATGGQTELPQQRTWSVLVIFFPHRSTGAVIEPDVVLCHEVGNQSRFASAAGEQIGYDFISIKHWETSSGTRPANLSLRLGPLGKHCRHRSDPQWVGPFRQGLSQGQNRPYGLWLARAHLARCHVQLLDPGPHARARYDRDHDLQTIAACGTKNFRLFHFVKIFLTQDPGSRIIGYESSHEEPYGSSFGMLPFS